MTDDRWATTRALQHDAAQSFAAMHNADQVNYYPNICSQCGGHMRPSLSTGFRACEACGFEFDTLTTVLGKKRYVAAIRQFRAKNKGLTCHR